VAILSNKGGDEQRSERAGSGEPIDFDPLDPDAVKVHYDLTAWTFDQRAELSEALATAELPHAWEDDELVIPEAAEDAVDALFERFDEDFGPFPIVLADDEPNIDFVLDEWSVGDRNALSDALIEAQIPHRWTGTTVLVAADAKDTVDELLDAIEAGELVADGDDDTMAPPDGALGTMFVAADKLAKDPLDADARTTLLELAATIDPKHPPYGLAPRAWASAVSAVAAINDRVVADGETAAGVDESEIIGLAQDLRSLVRPFV
jgi:hypothetical protein